MRILAVASGKGGVGKSTVSLGPARALVARGLRVGLLDADMLLPLAPLRFPACGARVRTHPLTRTASSRARACRARRRRQRQSFLMPAMLTPHVGRQPIEDVAWGEVDMLVVDLPPGTADWQQQFFAQTDVAGVIVVVGPQDAAHLDARKLLDLLRDAAVPVLGAVENMAGMRCPHCGERIDVFPPVAPERSILRDVALLVSVPLDPAGEFEPYFAELAERVA